MKKWIEQGGWYGDITLEGDYISLHRDKFISVNGNVIPLPVNVNEKKENILQLVTYRYRDQIIIAGQGGVVNGEGGSGNWLYEDGKWRVISPSFGTFACCFGTGALYLVVGPNQYRIYDIERKQLGGIINKQLGAQGIRYIDFSQANDGIITSDSTYGPQPYLLSQWILRNPDVVVGQGYQGGCIAKVLGMNNYQLEPGDCQFLRMYRRGNNLAIVIVKMLEISTVFYWLTVDELKLDFPPTFPLPNPPIPPIPIPEPMPMAPNEIDTVKNMLRAHPEVNVLDDIDRGKILDYSIADLQDEHWGRKSRNPEGSDLNTDVLGYRFENGMIEWIDVLAGSDPAPNNPDLGKYATWDTDGRRWRQGENGYWIKVDSNPIPEPIPNPPSTHIDKEDVRNGCNIIIAFYNQPIGLNRAARGIPSPIDVHDQAAWDWVAMFLTEMANGKTMDEALNVVINTIKTFPEYKEQHP